MSQSHHIVLLGVGPLPCEPTAAVLAPGARTWQLARTVSAALENTEGARLTVVCLVDETKPPFFARVGTMGATIFPLGYEDFVALEQSQKHVGSFPTEPIKAVVGCASVQPCATAALLAQRLKVPCFEDLFGDPLSEIQSAAPGDGKLHPDHETHLLHGWRLLTAALLGGDRFSTLSGPQRLALIGQLGMSGRLNQQTACNELVESIPFGLWPDDIPPYTPLPSTSSFRVLWSGSFNSWTDPKTLAAGICQALQEEPSLEIQVLGGAIAKYHEQGYADFRAGLDLGQAPMDRVHLLDWQPFSRMAQAYAECHAGLSLDRWSYEAVLGSRTRIVHLLAAGRPVISTALSELTRDMAATGGVISVESGNPESLAEALVSLARTRRAEYEQRSLKIRHLTLEKYGADRLAEGFKKWIIHPHFAEDHPPSPTNALIPYWERCRTSL